MILVLVMQTFAGGGPAIRHVRGGNIDEKGYIGYWIWDMGLYGLCFLTGLAAGVWDMESMINGLVAGTQRM